MKITKSKINSVLRKIRLYDCTKADLVVLLKAMCAEFYPDEYFDDMPLFRELKFITAMHGNKLTKSK